MDLWPQFPPWVGVASLLPFRHLRFLSLEFPSHSPGHPGRRRPGTGSSSPALAEGQRMPWADALPLPPGDPARASGNPGGRAGCPASRPGVIATGPHFPSCRGLRPRQVPAGEGSGGPDPWWGLEDPGLGHLDQVCVWGATYGLCLRLWKSQRHPPCPQSRFKLPRAWPPAQGSLESRHPLGSPGHFRSVGGWIEMLGPSLV